MTRMHRKLTEEYLDFFIHPKRGKVYLVSVKFDSIGRQLERAMCGSYSDPSYHVEVLNPNHKNCRRCIRYT